MKVCGQAAFLVACFGVTDMPGCVLTAYPKEPFLASGLMLTGVIGDYTWFEFWDIGVTGLMLAIRSW